MTTGGHTLYSTTTNFQREECSVPPLSLNADAPVLELSAFLAVSRLGDLLQAVLPNSLAIHLVQGSLLLISLPGTKPHFLCDSCFFD